MIAIYGKIINMDKKNNTLLTVLLVVVVAAISIGLVFVANQPSKEDKAASSSSSSSTQQSSSQTQNDYQVFTDLAKAEKFDAASVKELKVDTLKEGTGDVIAESDMISANYTGWNASGTIFDTTKKSADGPTTPIEFPLSGVIPGWTKGLAGQKVGGIYLLTIPADMAYGDNNSQSPEASGPLKFVVEVVSKK
jgi:FKBP-type peptidyl-prolyl cis-trans isomerase